MEASTGIIARTFTQVAIGPGSPSFNLVECPNGRTIDWNCGTEDEKNCNRVQKEDDFHFVVGLISKYVS